MKVLKVMHRWNYKNMRKIKMDKNEIIENAVRDIILATGENPDREGLLETPSRVRRSYEELYSGYGKNPEDVMKVFEADGYDELVLLKGIEMYSTCEHHLIPFIGTCSIAYIPSEKICGISKLARVMEIYARRMQIQERLTDQIANAINDILQPRGVGVVIEAQHLCMRARGISKQNSWMTTSSLLGVFREPEVRNEFLGLIK